MGTLVLILISGTYTRHVYTLLLIEDNEISRLSTKCPIITLVVLEETVAADEQHVCWGQTAIQSCGLP